MTSILDTLPEPGLLTIGEAEYHADPCPSPSLSSGVAKLLCSATPAHARIAHPKLNPAFEPTNKSSFDLGTAAHQLLLQGVEDVVIVEADNWMTKAAKEQRDAAYAAGRTPLLAKDWGRVQAMADAAVRQLEGFDLDPMPLTNGKPEQTLLWEEDGVWCRARYDWLHNNMATIDDLKTTAASADPRAWQRTMFGIGGDVQAAFYSRGIQRTFGVTPLFRFVVQEVKPPFALSIVTPSDAVMVQADEKVEHAISLWRECLRTNSWPAYSRELATVELPSWEQRKWDDLVLDEASV